MVVAFILRLCSHLPDFNLYQGGVVVQLQLCTLNNFLVAFILRLCSHLPDLLILGRGSGTITVVHPRQFFIVLRAQHTSERSNFIPIDLLLFPQWPILHLVLEEAVYKLFGTWRRSISFKCLRRINLRLITNL